MRSKGYRLSYESNVDIMIDERSQINLGHNTHLRKGVDIHAYDGAILSVGDNFFINKNSSILARYGITIGDNCMIGENTTVSDHDHNFSDRQNLYNTQGYRGDKIVIGDNVWIASGVFIGKGVRIGDNVVIGANTVVTKSIQSNSIVFSKVELLVRPLEKGEDKAFRESRN